MGIFFYHSRYWEALTLVSKKHLSIRMEEELHDKIQYVANYDGRSMSGLILHLMRECVRSFEKEHGPITPEDLKK